VTRLIERLLYPLGFGYLRSRGIFLPRRRDEVHEWLRSERDDYPRGSQSWCAVDKLLDNYREKADYGLRLDEPGGDP
jgi:hypothetical protein